MVKNIILAFTCLYMFGCGSENNQYKVDVQANPCATPGASYIEHFNLTSGNCPSVPDQLINIANDGTLPAANGLSCEKIEQDECRAHDTNCVSHIDDCTSTSTTDVKFSNDGSTASGLIQLEINCSDGSSCSGLYSVSATRQ